MVESFFIQHLISLVFASIMGLLVGLQREKDFPFVGLRTHTIVSLGSCLFTILSQVAVLDQYDDATRIISGMIGGIGFIGASAIIKENGTVRGESTAATIWGTAAVGVACGLQRYDLAVATTLLMLIMVWFLSFVDKLIEKRDLEQAHLRNSKLSAK